MFLEFMKPYESDDCQYVSHSSSQNSVLPARKNDWFDKYGLIHKLQNNTYSIIFNSQVNESVFKNLVNHLNAVPKCNVNIICDIDKINAYLNWFKKYTLNKNIRIIIQRSSPHNSKLMKFSSTLDLKNLPSNVKVDILSNSWVYALESWSLWQKDTDFQAILPSLGYNLKERMLEARRIVRDFYEKYQYELRGKSILERADFVFNWCLRNTSFADEETNSNGSLKSNSRSEVSDYIGTLKIKKGVCAGRSELLRMLLNNKYIQVPCYCVGGMHGDLQHQWVEVFDENNNKYYYDLSYKLMRFNGDLHDIYYSEYEGKLPKLELEKDVNPTDFNSIHIIYLNNILKYNSSLSNTPLGKMALKSMRSENHTLPLPPRPQSLPPRPQPLRPLPPRRELSQGKAKQLVKTNKRY